MWSKYRIFILRITFPHVACIKSLVIFTEQVLTDQAHLNFVVYINYIENELIHNHRLICKHVRIGEKFQSMGKIWDHFSFLQFVYTPILANALLEDSCSTVNSSLVDSKFWHFITGCRLCEGWTPTMLRTCTNMTLAVDFASTLLPFYSTH